MKYFYEKENAFNTRNMIKYFSTLCCEREHIALQKEFSTLFFALTIVQICMSILHTFNAACLRNKLRVLHTRNLSSKKSWILFEYTYKKLCKKKDLLGLYYFLLSCFRVINLCMLKGRFFWHVSIIFIFD